MSKRKGVSAEEKRTRMLDLFYEKKEFFQLKELEKIAPKEKGIIVQSVKDVVQSLVDDGLVDTEKIGTSIYYWAFQSKAVNAKKQKLEETKEKIEVTVKKLKKTKDAVIHAKVGREETTQRIELLQSIQKLTEENKKLEEEVSKYKEMDPETYQKLQEQTKVAKEAANRWTDNVFAIKSWCKNKFGFEDSVLDKQFEIPEDFDYIP